LEAKSLSPTIPSAPQMPGSPKSLSITSTVFRDARAEVSIVLITDSNAFV
jgi:hypothetical protein